MACTHCGDPDAFYGQLCDKEGGCCRSCCTCSAGTLLVTDGELSWLSDMEQDENCYFWERPPLAED